MCGEIKRKKAYAKVMSEVLRYSTNFFHSKGFTQMLPVMLSTVTDPCSPDPGSSIEKVGEIDYQEQRLCLTQSMILHKQIAIKGGMDKLFIVSPNVRLEHPKKKESGRHLFEFSQMDFEIAQGSMDCVLSLMESLICGVSAHVTTVCWPELEALGRALPQFSAPFPRHYTWELAKKFGDDWELPASLENKLPFWAISHKREFYDREDPDRPGTYRNYDLIYPEGFGEGLSGAEREWDYGRLVSAIEVRKHDKSRFRGYLELAKGGLVPSAGAGFGIERLVRYLCGAPHVGDVQMFRRVPGEKVFV